jgi:hypothetical protein
MTSLCDVIFELLCFYIEYNDNMQGVPKKVNSFKFKSPITYCSNSPMRHKWQPRSQALPSLWRKEVHRLFWTWKYWLIRIITETWHIFGQSLFVPLLILLQRYFGILGFIFHLFRSFSTFNTMLKFISNFKFQNCTLFIQYCTKCAILHTKIGPGLYLICILLTYAN